jgi:hypothetical protein
MVGVLVPLVSKTPETSDVHEDENLGASVPEAVAPSAQHPLLQRDVLRDTVYNTLYTVPGTMQSALTCSGLTRREEGRRQARVGVRTVRTGSLRLTSVVHTVQDLSGRLVLTSGWRSTF